MIAGAKGAVGSTVAVASTAMRYQPELVLPSLTTKHMLPGLDSSQPVQVVGWDATDTTLLAAIEAQGVLSEDIWKPYADELEQVQVRTPPSDSLDLKGQVAQLSQDIQEFRAFYPNTKAVLINLLPAAVTENLQRFP
jgi:hypothetical protein